jgi:antirestriction protein ArdC
MTNREVYARIGARLVALLEKGVTPWTRPWKIDPEAEQSWGTYPVNAAARRSYNGINILILWAAQMDRGFKSRGWVTFNQARKAGAIVTRGSKGEAVVFMKTLLRRPTDSNGKPMKDEPPKRILLARLYTVFNLDQLADLPDHDGAVERLRAAIGEGDGSARRDKRKKAAGDWNPLTAAEEMVAATGVTIRHGGNEASYSPAADLIRMPKPTQFKDRERYYSTLFHELTHWTGHPTRLNRQNGMFATTTYAMEELVAEIGAAFLSGRFGFDVVSHSAAYIKTWLSALRSDPALIVDATRAATKAADLITGESHQPEEEPANA